MNAVDITPVITGYLDDPVGMAKAWDRETQARAAPWHDATVQFDRVRVPEVEACRLGLPDPHDPNDPNVSGLRAFTSAAHYDADVLSWFGEQLSRLTLPTEVATREGVFDRVLEVAMANPPYVTPGPDRAQLEALLV